MNPAGTPNGISSLPTPNVYYGVHIPDDSIVTQCNVFEDKESALKLAKKHKKSRFKCFQFYHEAVDFSVNGCDNILNETEIERMEDPEKQGSVVSEKASPYRAPRPQELTEFRNKLESGNLAVVQEIIDLNPRYLVSSGDTPSILQEGARLNAIHVLAKAKHHKIIDFILNTISNPEFIKKLYGDDNQANAEQRCQMLLDLYLNTPNKGFNDTPLHIASKWGADKVVEVLISYPECDKTTRNKHNKLAQDVICERAEPNSSFSKKRISELLCDNYYVPIIRTEDNTMPPLVGQPFSPTSPPLLNRDPLSPRLEIHAYAGPMHKREAETFRKIWKTPSKSFTSVTPNSPVGELRLKDPDKGLERIGKSLAKDLNYCWKEYWAFLGCFVDICSNEGLEMLEKHLKCKEKHLHEPFEVFSPLVNKVELSPISNLCKAFSACQIEDRNGNGVNTTYKPLIYVDKACQVFANRIFSSVSMILKQEFGNTIQILETDANLLEVLVNSFMSDDRFNGSINFQKVHSRLAKLVAKRLQEKNEFDNNYLIGKLEALIESLIKTSDCFSSDDEAPTHKETSSKPTVYRKQVLCLLSRIKCALPEINEIDGDNWMELGTCNCVFHIRKPKGNIVYNRKNSKKHKRNQLQSVSKKLFVDYDHINDIPEKPNGNLINDSEEEYYTPPSSPVFMDSEETSDSEQFSDAEPPKLEVFLEGSQPSKTDYAVFNALKYANCDIDCLRYPTVFKWHHTVNLYKESERKSWPCFNSKLQSPDCTSPDRPKEKPSWMRVTGTNSPRAAIESINRSIRKLF